MEKFDLCIIGAGPAGYAAAVRAWDYGKNVCLIEKARVGGAAVYNGVLVSKTLWELSKDYCHAARTDRGYTANDILVDFKAIKKCVQAAVQEKSNQMSMQLDILATPSDENPGSITMVEGTARFLDNTSVQVEDKNGDLLVITADYFVIATGSRPRYLGTAPVDGESILTSDHIMSLEKFPESLVILGAGVVGCEFASVFSNYGQTKVYLIDRADRILPFEDTDISAIVEKNLTSKGATIHHLSHFVGMEVREGRVHYTIENPDGTREEIDVEKALVSVGRIPNTDSLGLENTSIETSDRGYIIHKDTQTNERNIYAVGDVTLDMALVNIGEIEGRHAVEKIFGKKKSKISYENLSTIIFVDPEIAAVGLNEQKAEEERISYREAIVRYPLNHRAVAMRATDGFVKILVTDDDDMQILGMRALGAHASTTIEAVALLIQQGRSIKELAELIHPHPAITEAVQECARLLAGSSLHKPNVFKEHLSLRSRRFD